MSSATNKFELATEGDKAVITGRMVSYDIEAISDMFDRLSLHFRSSASVSDKFHLTLYLDYISTWSRKRLMRFFSDIETIAAAHGTEIHVRWVTDEDDEDMVELGEILQEGCDLSFEFAVAEGVD